MKIAILGFGTIGGGVEIILRKEPGITIKRIFSRHVPAAFSAYDSGLEEILQDEEIDTAVETLGGIEPAYSYICEVLRAGKNVVTANKAVVAAHYRELAALAEEKNVSFRFTAAVGGGIPWLPNLERLKRADTVDSVGGIMNATCNLILSRMIRNGQRFDEVLEAAQEEGYAERDPSADIDGLDARRKLVISANTAFDCVLPEEAVPVFGIRHIRPEDLAAAAAEGKTVRLINRAFREEDGRIRILTAPAFIPCAEPEADVWETGNRICCHTRLGGTYSFGGQGAGRFPTALSVVQDLHDISQKKAVFYQQGFAPAEPDNHDWATRWYIRDAFGSRITDWADTALITQQLTERLQAKEAVFAAVAEEKKL
ncbi:MAG: homoserine dehydrogenase [Lachnospiraceae bacterium]|nr:homoserine dehydrogenase [Lachnospiraceae bacterium]